MHHYNGEDKAFFSITAFIGTITEYNSIIQAQVLSPDFINAVGSAATLAFISGFIGLVGKKTAEHIYHKVKGNKPPDHL